MEALPFFFLLLLLAMAFKASTNCSFIEQKVHVIRSRRRSCRRNRRLNRSGIQSFHKLLPLGIPLARIRTEALNWSQSQRKNTKPSSPTYALSHFIFSDPHLQTQSNQKLGFSLLPSSSRSPSFLLLSSANVYMVLFPPFFAVPISGSVFIPVVAVVISTDGVLKPLNSS